MFNYLKIIILLLYAPLLEMKYPYCFRFTWIGPHLFNNNIADLTCDHIRKDVPNIPCQHPLVTTADDNMPDTINLWNQYRNEPNKYGCPMLSGQSCIKYTYIYNKAVQNITYMCAKINNTMGCYRQKYISGLNVEVCACESQLDATPCNNGFKMHNNLTQASVLLLILRKYFNFISNEFTFIL